MVSVGEREIEMVKDLIKEIVITDDDKPGKRKALDAGAAQKVIFSGIRQ